MQAFAQCGAIQGELAFEPNEAPFFEKERFRAFEPERLCEKDVVAESGMQIQRQVRAENGHVGVERQLELAIRRAFHRLQPAPEQAVVNEQKIDFPLGGKRERRLAGVHRRADPPDAPAVLHLQPVEGVGPILHGVVVEQGREVFDEFREIRFVHIGLNRRKDGLSADFADFRR